MDNTRRKLELPEPVQRYVPSLPLRVAKVTRNTAIDLRGKRAPQRTGLRLFDEVVERSLTRTDISDHLTTLFLESLAVRPSLIVELGVRGGESTFVLERVARLYRAKLVSVDIEDCSHVSSYPDWSFVKSDDIAFAQRFPFWCREQGIAGSVDVLFIDTSHEFEHTLAEVRNWFPFLSNRCKVFVHDTNMRKVYYRKDGSIGFGWPKRRGVIAALETYFDRKFDERHDFTQFVGGWLLKHHALCCGLTILERVHDIAALRTNRDAATWESNEGIKEESSMRLG
jgi:cephalosporin hydroxylase